MKLSEARKIYYRRSSLASTSARQLAFAGIAVVWILATNSKVVELPYNTLRAPLLAFVIALALDLVQYYAGAAYWGAFGRIREKKEGAGPDDEIGEASRFGNWLPLGCFWLKGLAVAIGYYLLGKLLWPVLLS